MAGWSLKQSGWLPILLITHENGESGCCEDWLFCGPCYFNRDLQWNVFIRAEAAAQASSSGAELWPCSLLRGLGGSGPNQHEQTAFSHSTPPFLSLLQTAEMCVPEGSYIITVRNKRLNKTWATAKWFKDMSTGTRIFKENHRGNVIVCSTLHLGENFSFPPTFLSATPLRPMKWIWKQSTEKEEEKKHELLWLRRYKYVGVCCLSFLNPHIHPKNKKMRKTCTSNFYLWN